MRNALRAEGSAVSAAQIDPLNRRQLAAGPILDIGSPRGELRLGDGVQVAGLSEHLLTPMFHHPPPAAVTIYWPSDNTLNAAPPPADLIARLLSQLHEAGIAVDHRSERDEMVDIISGASSGYTHFSELFRVSGTDERAARIIIEAGLPMSLCCNPWDLPRNDGPG